MLCIEVVKKVLDCTSHIALGLMQKAEVRQKREQRCRIEMTKEAKPVTVRRRRSSDGFRSVRVFGNFE